MVESGKLYENVMEKLDFEPNIDASNITIAVKDDGVVVLGGTVKSYAEKHLAEKAVEKIEKVRGVANEITAILPSSYKRNDADIVKAAIDTLKWTMFVPYEQIKVAVENGHLTLSGEVSYNYQKERAQIAVQDLFGVNYFTNNIKVKSSIKPDDVKNKIIKEFERNARIDANNIQIEVDGDKVTLKGKIKNFDELREAVNAAWSIPGVSNVIDHLSITL